MKQNNKERFLRVQVLTGEDRTGNCEVAIPQGWGGPKVVRCPIGRLSLEKPDTAQILQMLNHTCVKMIEKTDDYDEKTLIMKIFNEAISVIRKHQ